MSYPKRELDRKFVEALGCLQLGVGSSHECLLRLYPSSSSARVPHAS
jgi:hypothetical protein